MSYLTLIDPKKCFDLLSLYYVVYVNETITLCLSSKVGYCDDDDDEFKFNDASTQWVICV